MGVHYSSDMGCGKDLAEGEKVLVIKEITIVKTNKSIAERIYCCVLTETDESVRIFEKILQRGTLGRDRGAGRGPGAQTPPIIFPRLIEWRLIIISAAFSN